MKSIQFNFYVCSTRKNLLFILFGALGLISCTESEGLLRTPTLSSNEPAIATNYLGDYATKSEDCLTNKGVDRISIYKRGNDSNSFIVYHRIGKDGFKLNAFYNESFSSLEIPYQRVELEGRLTMISGDINQTSEGVYIDYTLVTEQSVSFCSTSCIIL